MRYICLVFFLTLLSLYSQGQDCLEHLKQANRKMKALREVPAGKVYHYSFTVKTTFNEKLKKPVQENRVNVYFGNGQCHLITNGVNIYQDEKQAVVLLPAQKYISVLDRENPNVREGMKDLDIQEALLKDVTVESCTDKGNLLEMILIPGKNQGGIYKISKLKVVLDKNEQKILKTFLLYPPDEMVKEVEYTFGDLDKDHDQYKITASLTDRFFDKDGKLKGEYKNYHLIDRREP